jgi:hypothetical protein
MRSGGRGVRLARDLPDTARRTPDVALWVTRRAGDTESAARQAHPARLTRATYGSTSDSSPPSPRSPLELDSALCSACMRAATHPSRRLRSENAPPTTFLSDRRRCPHGGHSAHLRAASASQAIVHRGCEEHVHMVRHERVPVDHNADYLTCLAEYVAEVLVIGGGLASRRLAH